MTLRLALDAMGGDHAPQVTAAGALAFGQQTGRQVLLVGPSATVCETVRSFGYAVGEPDERGWYPVAGTSVYVVPSGPGLPDGGHPALALRRDPSLSLNVTARLVAEGLADAAVSLGHTGGCLVAARWTIGCLPGIERPAAGLPLPFCPSTFLIDLGPNADCSAQELAQFALLGTVYAQVVMGCPRPRVALLSNGTEKGKGTPAVQRAYTLLERSPLHFVGNVEGRDLPFGCAEVVVADGFVANILIKFMEGLAQALLAQLEGVPEAHPPLRQLREKLHAMTDITDTPYPLLLLGAKGIFVPGHGRAQAHGVIRALEHAARAAEAGLLDRIRTALEQGVDPRLLSATSLDHEQGGGRSDA